MSTDRRAARSLRNSCNLRGCGNPKWGWTNLMEPLCLNHFNQRRVVQNLLVMLSGCGNWASLIIFNNPEGFKPWYEETLK